MALLKKIRSATLMEALVATVLIVVIFMVAGLMLNNLLFNSFSKRTHAVETRLNELSYFALSGEITVPYRERYAKWDITLEKIEGVDRTWLKMNALHIENRKEVTKSYLYEGY